MGHVYSCAQPGDDCVFRLGLGFEGLLAWHLNGDLAEFHNWVYRCFMQNLCKHHANEQKLIEVTNFEIEHMLIHV